MIKFLPLIFILLWSSAFITTKPIVDNSDPFTALAFRFFVVAIGFYLFSIYLRQSVIVSKKNLIECLFSGVLFHGFYLGGVFYALSKGISVSLIALLVSLQPILTSILARIYLNETLSKFQWLGIFFGFSGAFIIILPDIIHNGIPPPG